MKMITSDLQEQKPNELEEQNEDEPKSNVTPLKAIGGGKGGDYPWLLDRPIGSNFLCKSGKSEIDLFEYWVIAKGERAVKIVLIQGTEEKQYWVDPVEFSKVMFLYEIISD